jgi:hypothetical protein
MGRRKELLDRMCANPLGDWTLSDVETICREYGVTCNPPAGGGSHDKLSDPASLEVLTIPYRRPIKPVHIRLLVRFIETILAARGELA